MPATGIEKRRKRLWRVFPAVAAALIGCGGVGPTPVVSGGLPPEKKADPTAVHHLLAAKRAERVGAFGRAVAEWQAAIDADSSSPYLHLSLAGAYRHLGQLSPAESQALIAARQDSTNEEVHTFLAALYRQKSDFPNAIAHLERVVALGGDEETAWRLVHLYTGMGRIDDAERVVVDMAAVASGSWQAQSQWVRVATRVGLNGAAEKILRDNTAEFPQREEAWVQLGGLLSENERVDDAEDAFRDGLIHLPESDEISRRLGWLLLSQERWDEAIALVTDQTVENGEDVRERLAWIEVLLQKGQPDLAASEARRFLELRPNEIGALVQLGQALVALDKIDESLVVLMRVAEISEDYRVWKSLSMRLAHDEKYIEAEMALRRALIQHPAHPVLSSLLAATLQRQERYDEAVGVYGVLLAQDPDNKMVQFGMASALEQSGKFDVAVRMFQNLLHSSPDDARVLNYLGYMWADHGVRLEDAHKLIRKALAQEPENGAYLDSMGWVLYRMGQFKDAEPYLARAIEREGNHPVLLDHMGDLLKAQGRREEAKDYWERSLLLDPENAAIQQKLDTFTANSPDQTH